MVTLVRRELWEHRNLWIAPLGAGIVIVLIALLTGRAGDPIVITVNGHEEHVTSAINNAIAPHYFGRILGVTLAMQFSVALSVLFFYLLDALYGERKDRSILFWKSLPVSDAMTVASKAVTALLVVPLMVFAISLLVGLVVFLVIALRFSGTDIAAAAAWQTGAWFTAEGLLLADVLVGALWYAPVAAALLLASAIARRSPFLWVFLPLLFVVIVERSFGTHYVVNFVMYRLGGFFASLGSFAGLPYSPLPLLGNIDLWLGAVAAVGLLAVAVRLRRWRDDT
jgi:ABC-2 type transport system permease protein